ncbi:hypothetical protein JCM33374_g1681 [Metschnikowia sp. JCM 33374]|nr:hypothetical protein JCM33374_g1681 [Metschnikowia sp. JCM 33374]
MPQDFNAQRRQLREANLQAAENQHVVTESGRKLDSSLKKNTSFIKKIKTLNADTAPAILAEIAALTLEKYLSEITASLAEGLFKVSKADDVNAGLFVISALYQRFGASFSAPLLSHLVNAALEKPDSGPALRHKCAFRVIFEMQLLGIPATFADCAAELLGESAAKFYSKLGSTFISATLLKDLMAYRLETGYALPVVTSFLRRFGPLFYDEDEEQKSLFPDSLHTTLRQIFVVYTTRVLEILQALHTKLLKLEASSKKASIRTGKILAEHQDLVDETAERKAFFVTNTTVICELLHLQMPVLEEEKKPEPQREIIADQEKKSWWEDVKERDFYQDVPGYKDVVENFDRKKLPEAEYAPLSEGQKVNLFISQLEALIDSKDVDLITVLMHTYIPYNKATKNRILRFFAEVKKIDNVNLYARFLCVNAEYFPEVISELIETLDRGFRSSIHFDTINFRNLAFFIELVKFKLIPSHVVFHKIRRMTLSIAGTNNVDILSVFYERCGKFLLFEPEYRETTQEMLDLLQQQAKSDKLSINEKLSLSNMFLIVDSFTATTQKHVPRPELTTLQDFIHQVVKKLVSPTSCQLALELLNAIDFSKNVEAYNTLAELFSRPEDLGGDRLNMSAELLMCIGKKHRRVVITILDILTEKVIRGLELNDYRQNVARVAQVKMFAAFFNSKLLNFRSIMDLLFKIVCFGYPNNLPTPMSQLEIDPPENYFRIQLVCALLKAINFRRVKELGLLSSGVKTVEGFLVFLQYYSLCKVGPLPKDIEFSLLSVLDGFNDVSSTKMEKARDLASAMQALQQYTVVNRQEAKTRNQPASTESRGDDVDSVDSGLSALELSDSDEEDSGSDSESQPNENSSDDELSASDEEVTSSDDDSDEDSSDSDDDSEFVEGDETDDEEAQHAFQLRSAVEKKEAQRMDDEIKNLLSASMHQSRGSAPLRMPVPSTLVASSHGDKEPSKTFKFLTKSNNMRDLALPSNNQFTERIASEQAAQKANRKKIMSLVDNMYES